MDILVEVEVDSKGAWFGSAELKAEVLARMIDHRAHDEITRGIYQRLTGDDRRYRGCLIGCTLPLHLGGAGEWVGVEEPRIGWHGEVERLYGIPYAVALLLDNAFEDVTTFDAAADFAVDSIEAIEPGADLLYSGSRLRGLDRCPISTDEVLEYLRNAPPVGR